MPKVKVKKKSTIIDMTAMSDVTVLLLTFFMLTSTFIKKEPVQVITPGSYSETAIPETNVLSILIAPTGNIFMGLDKQEDKIKILRKVGEDYNITFTDRELYDFSVAPSFGVPIEGMKKYLSLPIEEQDKILQELGIPNDTVDNQFKRWVKYAKEVNPDLIIAIKADQATPYPVVKGVMESLRDLRENRYSLLTSLKAGAADEEAAGGH